jgi:hypothetical protein
VQISNQLTLKFDVLQYKSQKIDRQFAPALRGRGRLIRSVSECTPLPSEDVTRTESNDPQPYERQFCKDIGGLDTVADIPPPDSGPGFKKHSLTRQR